MRGHEPLIAMRQRGRRPIFARFELDPMPWSDWANWPEWSDVPMIELQAQDRPERLDLRCVVGMPAMVCGSQKARVKAMVEALQKAGATRVIAIAGDARDSLAYDSLEGRPWPN